MRPANTLQWSRLYSQIDMLAQCESVVHAASDNRRTIGTSPGLNASGPWAAHSISKPHVSFMPSSAVGQPGLLAGGMGYAGGACSMHMPSAHHHYAIATLSAQHICAHFRCSALASARGVRPASRPYEEWSWRDATHLEVLLLELCVQCAVEGDERSDHILWRKSGQPAGSLQSDQLFTSLQCEHKSVVTRSASRQAACKLWASNQAGRSFELSCVPYPTRMPQTCFCILS